MPGSDCYDGDPDLKRVLILHLILAVKLMVKLLITANGEYSLLPPLVSPPPALPVPRPRAGGRAWEGPGEDPMAS